MAAYSYIAINAAGAELSGEIHARDTTAAHDALRVRGLLALDLKERGSSQEGLGSAVKKVKQRSLQVFSRQFATMIQSGLNVVAALTILEEQTEDQNLATVIARRAQRRRGRTSPLRGHGTASARLHEPLHLDGRGRRGRRHSRHRARARGDPDREGNGDQASRQGRDGVSADRSRVCLPRADRAPDVSRPDLREDLQGSRRRSPDPDQGRRLRLRSRSRLLVHPLPDDRTRDLDLPLLEEDRHPASRVWDRFRVRVPGRYRQGRPEDRDGALHANPLEPRRCGCRHHPRRSRSPARHPAIR